MSRPQWSPGTRAGISLERRISRSKLSYTIRPLVQSENRVRSGAVRMPGDPERETGARRLCEGIPVDTTTLQKLREAVGEAGF